MFVPTSLDQEIGEGLGTQAGEAKSTKSFQAAASLAYVVRPRSIQHGDRDSALETISSAVAISDPSGAGIALSATKAEGPRGGSGDPTCCERFA